MSEERKKGVEWGIHTDSTPMQANNKTTNKQGVNSTQITVQSAHCSGHGH